MLTYRRMLRFYTYRKPCKITPKSNFTFLRYEAFASLYSAVKCSHTVVCCAFTSIASLAKSLLKAILHFLRYEAFASLHSAVKCSHTVVCCAFTSIASLAKSLLKAILHFLRYEAFASFVFLANGQYCPYRTVG